MKNRLILCKNNSLSSSENAAIRFFVLVPIEKSFSGRMFSDFSCCQVVLGPVSFDHAATYPLPIDTYGIFLVTVKVATLPI